MPSIDVKITIIIPWYLKLYITITKIGCAIGIPINQDVVERDVIRMVKLKKTNPQ